MPSIALKITHAPLKLEDREAHRGAGPLVPRQRRYRLSLRQLRLRDRIGHGAGAACHAGPRGLRGLRRDQRVPPELRS